jgi:hypothetical protein
MTLFRCVLDFYIAGTETRIFTAGKVYEGSFVNDNQALFIADDRGKDHLITNTTGLLKTHFVKIEIEEAGKIYQVKQKALELCHKIETLPASELQTEISIMASDLYHEIGQCTKGPDPNPASLFNEGLEWAAGWLESYLQGEQNERVVEFTKAMAESIRAAKKPLS